MKKLLLILVWLPLLFACGNQSSKENQENIETHLRDAEFVISDEFSIADDETFTSYLKETLSELNIEEFSKNNVELSDEGWKEVMLEWKEITKLYLRKNAPDNGENIIIKYSEVAPSEFWLNKLKSEMKQQESAFSQTIGMDFVVLDSGMNKYKNSYTYIYLTSKISYEGMSRYALQCIISVNNKSYQIFINTYERLSLDDVIINIK